MATDLSKVDTSKKQIVLSVQELITYGAFLIAFGGSIYTFFNAIPKLNTLTEKTNDLDRDVHGTGQKVEDLSKLLDNMEPHR